ncbi:MAG: Asp23/Gls24 family envelope stress response protein [Faecalibacterium sp.]
MITSRFPLGDVSFTAEYFSTLVGEATKQCYGVAAMAPRDMADAVVSLVRGTDYSERGVRVTQQDGRLVIELHIAVSYGLNISTAARSISHRIKDQVEQATGLKVARVIVSVDDVIA